MLRLKNNRMSGEEALATACSPFLTGSMLRTEEGRVVFLNSTMIQPTKWFGFRRMKIRLVFLIKLPGGVNAPVGNSTSPPH